MREVSIEAGLGNRFRNGGIIQLLGPIDLMSPWISTRVVMSKVLMVGLNRADDVPFHDLHVIDVVKQFEMIACDFFAKLNSPAR